MLIGALMCIVALRGIADRVCMWHVIAFSLECFTEQLPCTLQQNSPSVCSGTQNNDQLPDPNDMTNT